MKFICKKLPKCLLFKQLHRSKGQTRGANITVYFVVANFKNTVPTRNGFDISFRFIIQHVSIFVFLDVAS